MKKEIKIYNKSNLPTADFEIFEDLQEDFKIMDLDRLMLLKKAIVERGFKYSFKAWKDMDGKLWIIDAHRRKQALKMLQSDGYYIAPIPYELIHAETKKEAIEEIAFVNSQYSDINPDTELFKKYEINLEDLPISMKEFNISFGDSADENVIDDGFINPDKIKTDIKYGDMFKIGNHFLLCGDATKKEDCEKLMQGLKADMIFTDPPYDLEDDYSHNIFDMAKEDCHIFIMNSDKILIKNVNNGIQWFRKFFAVDFRQARLISNNQPMTRVDLIAEFCKGKTKFNNLRDGFSTLIECAKIHNDNESINFGHKQAKKIDLPANFIKHYSNENEIIIDLFGGSGSTMAACEQLNRNCYIMEFEPENCQIIIDRMKKCYNVDCIKL